jgi:2-oxo-4-hydroxy-4-carboxy--5-ureidoimidazoline (OHCU) decarboxylase/GNAT superfamily N-acetyltransferase
VTLAPAIAVRDFGAADHAWARQLIGAAPRGDHRVVRLGEVVDPVEHEGIVAELDGRPAGLLTVTETDRGLEVLTLHSAEPGRGIGTHLLETALRVAAASGSTRLWGVTTNDDLPAIRWALRRGMHVAAVHEGAAERDRRTVAAMLPPVNPSTGIPIRDYVELELDPGDGETLRATRIPTMPDIDALPREAAEDALAPLFEGAPRFVSALVAERPFGDDASFAGRARETARSLDEAAQIELLDAHPRIGANLATVSDLSRTEQAAGNRAEPEEPWIAEELDALNDAYERVFGFRFVIFVAGRPRREIVPILEASLREDRISELRRGLDDVVHIASDRLRTLRS